MQNNKVTGIRLERANEGKPVLVSVTETRIEADERTLNMMLADAYANLAHHQAKVDEYLQKIEQIQELLAQATNSVID